jgi:hypothetical protein
MIQIDAAALREGCERAHDLFLLNRLRDHDEAAAAFEAVYTAFGLDPSMRETLQAAITDLLPVRGIPALEMSTVMGMMAGVLVGLLIADSAMPADELDMPVLPIQ